MMKKQMIAQALFVMMLGFAVPAVYAAEAENAAAQELVRLQAVDVAVDGFDLDAHEQEVNALADGDAKNALLGAIAERRQVIANAEALVQAAELREQALAALEAAAVGDFDPAVVVMGTVNRDELNEAQQGRYDVVAQARQAREQVIAAAEALVQAAELREQALAALEFVAQGEFDPAAVVMGNVNRDELTVEQQGRYDVVAQARQAREQVIADAAALALQQEIDALVATDLYAGEYTEATLNNLLKNKSKLFNQANDAQKVQIEAFEATIAAYCTNIEAAQDYIATNFNELGKKQAMTWATIPVALQTKEMIQLLTADNEFTDLQKATFIVPVPASTGMSNGTKAAGVVVVVALGYELFGRLLPKMSQLKRRQKHDENLQGKNMFVEAMKEEYKAAKRGLNRGYEGLKGFFADEDEDDQDADDAVQE